MEDSAQGREGGRPLAGRTGEGAVPARSGLGWFIEEVGFEQRFETGGLNLAEKELGSLVGLGLRVQGTGVTPEWDRGLGYQGKDPGHCPQGSGSHRRVEA